MPAARRLLHPCHRLRHVHTGLVDHILADRDRIRKIDVYYCDELMEKYTVFITYPMVATQAAGSSDITRRTNGYHHEFLVRSTTMLSDERWVTWCGVCCSDERSVHSIDHVQLLVRDRG